MPDMNENAETQQEYLGRCHDCTAPQTEVNMLSRHILELQADKGRLIDNVNDLEDKLANADYQLEGRDNEIRELQEEITRLKGDLELWESGACRATNLDKCGVVKELKAQIEKLIDFVLSKTECCDVCPITDTCINSEGTCPYAGILAKGEEEVTREWLMQFISEEIKEK